MKRGFARLRQAYTYYLKVQSYAKEFFAGEMLYYAASLSFYTIFALVPILLISITIMANLPSFEGYVSSIKEEIFSNLMPAKSQAISEYMDSILKNGLQIGLVGIFYVILTSLLFFNNYEHIVSKIFTKPKKKFFNALSTYWTLMTFTPLVLALILFMATEASGTLAHAFEFMHLSFKGFTSFIISWLLFFVLMKVSLNFTLSSKAVLRSAFITAFVWYVAQKLFISYIFANTTYSSLYGSFSSILLFFMWIYVSWIVYLYGLKSTAYMQRYIEHRDAMNSCKIEDKPKRKKARQEVKTTTKETLEEYEA